MNKKLVVLSILLLIAAGIATGFDTKEKQELSLLAYKVQEDELNFYVPSQEEIYTDSNYSNSDEILFLGKSYIAFKEAIGFKESQGKYHVVNPFGYMGKYQFSKHTLELMGFKDLSNFLEDSHQQEKAFYAYTSYNKWVLRNDIKRYVGKTIAGVKITESGILAAAHLAGPGNVKKFLRSSGSADFSDANGATVRYYMKKFSGYDTSNVVANRKPSII